MREPSPSSRRRRLDKLITTLMSRVWKKSDGSGIGISRLLIDTGYEPDVVRGAIARYGQRQEVLPAVMPSRGFGITATKKPFSAYAKKIGDQVGWHWRAVKPNSGELRCIDIDTNHFKRIVHQQLFVPREQTGAFCLYGDERTDHALIADHLTAEQPKIMENKTDDRTVVQWELKPARERSPRLHRGLLCRGGHIGRGACGRERTEGPHASTATETERFKKGESMKVAVTFNAIRDWESRIDKICERLDSKSLCWMMLPTSIPDV